MHFKWSAWNSLVGGSWFATSKPFGTLFSRAADFPIYYLSSHSIATDSEMNRWSVGREGDRSVRTSPLFWIVIVQKITAAVEFRKLAALEYQDAFGNPTQWWGMDAVNMSSQCTLPSLGECNEPS
jgi:hypothetical protein